MTELLRLSLEEVCISCNLSPEIVEMYIQQEWIVPQDKGEQNFDQEDLARMILIRDLKQEMGVNDEAIPIVLHLIDQLHLLRRRLRHLGLEGLIPKE